MLRPATTIAYRFAHVFSAALVAFAAPHSHALTETVGGVVLKSAPHADVFIKDTVAGSFTFTNVGTPSVAFDSLRVPVPATNEFVPAPFSSPSTYASMTYGFSVLGPISSFVQVDFTGVVRLQSGGTTGTIPAMNSVIANFSVASGPGNVISGTFDVGPNGVAVRPGGADTGTWFARGISSTGAFAEDIMPGSTGWERATEGQTNWIDARFYGHLMVATDSNGIGRGRADIGLSGSTSTDFTDWLPGTTFQIASGYIDPFFSINANYLASNPGVTLSVEPGMGNLAPVPEPAAWAMLPAGLALLAARTRRRSRSSGNA